MCFISLHQGSPCSDPAAIFQQIILGEKIWMLIVGVK